MKALGVMMIFLAAAGFAQATAVTAPEIDGNSGAAALALLSGGFAIARSRRQK